MSYVEDRSTNAVPDIIPGSHPQYAGYISAVGLCMKPVCSLIRCSSMVGAILYHSFVECVRVRQEGYW